MLIRPGKIHSPLTKSTLVTEVPLAAKRTAGNIIFSPDFFQTDSVITLVTKTNTQDLALAQSPLDCKPSLDAYW